MKHIIWMLIFGFNIGAVDGWAKVTLTDQEFEAAVRYYFQTTSGRVEKYNKDKTTVLKIAVTPENLLSDLEKKKKAVLKAINEGDVKGLIDAFKEAGYQLIDKHAQEFLGVSVKFFNIIQNMNIVNTPRVKSNRSIPVIS